MNPPMAEFLRAFFLTPFPLFISLVSLSIVLQRPLRRAYERIGAPKLVAALRIAFLIVLIGYAVVVLWYLFSPAYLDQVSPSIAAVSWLFAQGEPVYHALDAGTGLRPHQRRQCSRRPTGRALIGSPVRQRSRSSASAAAPG